MANAQPSLPGPAFLADPEAPVKSRRPSSVNKLAPQDLAFHDWYRFVLSFPPHLVRDYMRDFELSERSTVLDPFCGTGTTLVEAQLNGLQSVGVEANPFAHFASRVKVSWKVDPEILLERAHEIAEEVLGKLRSQGIEDGLAGLRDSSEAMLTELGPEAQKMLVGNSISPLPLHKTLVLLQSLKAHQAEAYYDHALLALAKALVFSISNLRFGLEVGVGKAKADAPVVEAWLKEVGRISADLRNVLGGLYPSATVHLADARDLSRLLEPDSIDAVITSPPYPNEKDYTRTTRVESVILGFFNDRQELRSFKKTLIRSNTRGVYKEDDDDKWVLSGESFKCCG